MSRTTAWCFGLVCVLSVTALQPRMKCIPVKSLWRHECAERTYHCVLRLVALLVLGAWQVTGLLGSSPAQAETRFIPSVSVSGRYDSNVWYGPRESVPPGGQQWDLVTTAQAQAHIENKSRLGDTIVDAGLTASAFAYNTDLAFVSTNVAVSSDLSDLAKEFLPGLRFRVSDAFLFTPETPAFLAGGKGVDSPDVFSRGIQAVRANTFSNILGTHGEYSLSRSINLRTDYSYSIFRVGQLFARSPTEFGASFFDTTVHNVAMGPTYRLEGGDTLFLKYGYASVESIPTSGGGTSLRYSAHTIAPEYVSAFFRGWTLTMSGGATLIEQAGSRTFFSGRLALGTNLEPALRVQVSVSRQVAPAFFGIGGAMISNVAQLYISQRFSKVLQLIVSGSYAHAESAPVSAFSLESIVASATLEYKITRTYKVALSQEYNQFEYTGTPRFDRHATMFTLTAEWK